MAHVLEAWKLKRRSNWKLSACLDIEQHNRNEGETTALVDGTFLSERSMSKSPFSVEMLEQEKSVSVATSDQIDRPLNGIETDSRVRKA